MNSKTTRITPEQVERQQRLCAEIRDYWTTQGVTPTAYVETYGCQQNEADSEQLRGMLEAAGYGLTDSAEGADAVIFNTCAIREHAEQRVFGNVGALVHTKRRHPRQKIFLCGCMMGQPAVVERVKNSYPYVDAVFSTHHLWEFPSLLLRVLTGKKRVFSVEDSAGSIAEGIPVVRTNTLKAWVSIMYGCNNFCSYCIVPYVRGRERSRRPQDVLDECRALIAQGYKEITLLGQNVNSYGRDLDCGMDFADLLAAVAELDGEFRLRFMTSHPKDASRKLFDTIAKYDKICKQFHLPFQSGNDRVLHAMNRRYTAAQYLELVDYGRSLMPELVLTSDVIVGFPGETEAEFAESLAFAERCGFAAMHVFPYSRRPGTPAASMPGQLTRVEKEERAAKAGELARTLRERYDTALLGKPQEVLFEQLEDDFFTGHARNGVKVYLRGEALHNQIRIVTPTALRADGVEAKPAAQ